MNSVITAKCLFDHLKERLKLDFLGGEQGKENVIKSQDPESSGFPLVGHLNFIRSNKIQVLGKTEVQYLDNLGKNALQDALSRLFADETAMVVIADGQEVSAELVSLADRTGIPLLHTVTGSQDVITHFRYFLGNILATSITLHGVYMEVMGNGVLLVGESGIGKSELALELISRGHRLVADDAPEFTRIAPDIINGTCPELLREFLEVRGLGVLNIRAIFGDSAIKTNKYLRLIISLEKMSEEKLQAMDRLRGSKRSRDILGVEIPEITLPVAPGRNLAVAVETAVRNHILLRKGYDAAEDFIQRQENILERES